MARPRVILKVSEMERMEQAGELPIVVYPPGVERPRTRGDCAGGPRPCPFVTCRYNLYLEVLPNGAVRLPFPEREPEDVPPEASCALDVADGGANRREEVSALMNISREAVRQIEDQVIRRIRHRRGDSLREYSVSDAPQRESAWDHAGAYQVTTGTSDEPEDDVEPVPDADQAYADRVYAAYERLLECGRPVGPMMGPPLSLRPLRPLDDDEQPGGAPEEDG